MVLQRDACAAADAVLDLLYFTTFQLAAYFSGSLAYNIPVSTYAYMSCFWPLLHIYTVAQALEAAALRRHEEINALAKRRGPRKPTRRLTLDALKETAQLVLKEDAGVANSRLPSWAAILYVLGTLGFIGMVFITKCGRDRYPFGNWNGPCHPMSPVRMRFGWFAFVMCRTGRGKSSRFVFCEAAVHRLPVDQIDFPENSHVHRARDASAFRRPELSARRNP